VQLIEDGGGLDWAMLAGVETLGITAAASTPESCATVILELLGARFTVELSEHRETDEAIMFKKLRLD
jgi:4-hydroxy-3-methylbut-2-enyl diphosphate reductase IspH